MSELNSTSLDKTKQRQLAIRRAQFIKKLKIRVKPSDKIIDQDRLILIQTYNTQKNTAVQFVMRRLSQLDSLVAHINNHYGGHIIPSFTHDLYFQNSINMSQLVPQIQQYLVDLKNNKYCRQDIKYYCFMIEQHASFPIQLSFSRVISNATDASRRYLNDLFTRKDLPNLKNTDVLIQAHKQLDNTIQHYYEIKQLSIIKVKQTMIFQQVEQIFTELSASPGLALEPQQGDIQFIMKSIQSSQKLIIQANQAFKRWQKLVQSVRQLQNNVYKGLHQYQIQFKQRDSQLQQWSQSLSRQFDQLCGYLENKLQALSGQVYKINKKIIDATVFAGQSNKLDDQQISNKKQCQTNQQRETKQQIGQNNQKIEQNGENKQQIEHNNQKIQQKKQTQLILSQNEAN